MFDTSPSDRDLALDGIAELYVREFHEAVGRAWPSSFTGKMSGGPSWKKQLLLPQELSRLANRQGEGSMPGLWAPPYNRTWYLDLDDCPAREALVAAVIDLAHDLVAMTDRQKFVAWLRQFDPGKAKLGLSAAPVSRVLSIIGAD